MKSQKEIKQPFFLFKWFSDIKNRTVGIVTDILNYIYVWRTIRKYKNTVEWKDLNLRHDYLGRIYTVVSLRAEDFGETDPAVRELRYREKSESVYLYLTELNLHEIISPDITYIPDTYSYLVKFVPLFRSLSLGWFIWFIIRILFFYGIFYCINLVFNLSEIWQNIIFYLKLHHIIK